jgi:quercetin dioxygenase-like cupin family protein
MQIIRVYTGDDERSHFEEIDVPLSDQRLGRVSKMFGAAGIVFRETPGDTEMDFHNAPRRQFVITLSGGAEIECGDGSRRQLGAGDILLADDTTGQGHITRETAGPRRSIFVPLPDDFDVDALRS